MRSKIFDYFICMSKIEYNNAIKSLIFSVLDPLSSKLLVSEEKHSDSKKIHFHIYMRSINEVGFLK